MKICAHALVLILCSSIFSGCFATVGVLDRYCDEDEYWIDFSEEYPYPGLECDAGPIRILSLTIFVYKDNDGEDYISNEESITQGIDLINSVYNQHGIGFALGEIVWVDEAFLEAGGFRWRVRGHGTSRFTRKWLHRRVQPEQRECCTGNRWVGSIQYVPVLHKRILCDICPRIDLC